MLTVLKLLAAAGAVCGFGGGCGALAWFVTKDSKISQSNEKAGNCRSVELTRDLIDILEKLNPEHKDDYVAVSCQNTDLYADNDEDRLQFPEQWTGLFPADFFIGQSHSTKKGERFSMKADITAAAGEAQKYIAIFEGSTVPVSRTGELERGEEVIGDKSITKIKVTVNKDETPKLALLLKSISSKK